MAAVSKILNAKSILSPTRSWSPSRVLIKYGLEDIPALTFAGLRYTLAFLVLAPLVAMRLEHRNAIGSESQEPKRSAKPSGSSATASARMSSIRPSTPTMLSS